MAAPLPNRTRVSIATVGLVCVSLALTAYSSRNPWLARSGAYLVSELLSPFQSAFTSVFSIISQGGTDYIDLVTARDNNRALVDRLRVLEEDNARMIEYRFENEQLRSLLAMSGEVSDEGIGASVIGYDPSGWTKGIVIDKGQRDGLEVGMPVVVGVGLVGQTVAVSRTSSRVLLIVDHSSGVDVLVQDSRARGVSEGSGAAHCNVEYVRTGETVRVGDRVITSGMDGVYPKGLLVGHVSEVGKPLGAMFQTVELRPAVDFEKLEQVFVVKEPRARNLQLDESAEEEPGEHVE